MDFDRGSGINCARSSANSVGIGKPIFFQNLRIAAIIRARRLGCGDPGRNCMAIKEPAPGRRAVDPPNTARHQHERERQSVTGARFVPVPSCGPPSPPPRPARRDRVGPQCPRYRICGPLTAMPIRVATSVPAQIAPAMVSGSKFAFVRGERQRHRNDAGARRGA